ncbi:MAG TPA: polysaccharide biosynthesis tyrosine autokinase, partial [Myxococcales bacterium]|nr:polysaccharide biosynthesis tyrosine autokinase [Myxococcales bacterium]
GEEKNLVALLDGAKVHGFDAKKKQIEFEKLKRQSDINRRLYELVLKRTKDIELSGLLRTSNVRVLDPARPSYAPIRPDLRKALTLALLVGLLLGLGMALLLELMDNSVFSQVDVEQRVGVPFLGLVPVIPESRGAGSRDLYVHDHPKSSIAECCRAIRTNVLFMSPERPLKTILVTSTAPQEGKSTSVINLGISMAQSGNRVVLVDTDMRRPRLHKAFQIPNDVGVSSVVVGEGTVEAAVKTTDVPGLFVVPCGPIPPNPAELLHTQAFSRLLEELGKRFDRIILDSPPIHPVADAIVLATQAEGVVLILKAGLTNRTLAKRAVRALRDVKAKVYGAILNSVDLEDPKYGGYYADYRRYGYYYGERRGSDAVS